MRISPNFYLHEFLRSQTAARKGIDMTPSEEIKDNIERLCVVLLEPLRDLLGGVPIIPTSGYRPEALNTAIGGSKNSAHMYGRAVDFVAIGVKPRKICLILRDSNLPYDQNIHEHGEWVHLGIAEKGKTGRKEDLTAYRKDEETFYAKGIYKIKDLL